MTSVFSSGDAAGQEDLVLAQMELNGKDEFFSRTVIGVVLWLKVWLWDFQLEGIPFLCEGDRSNGCSVRSCCSQRIGREG